MYKNNDQYIRYPIAEDNVHLTMDSSYLPETPYPIMTCNKENNNSKKLKYTGNSSTRNENQKLFRGVKLFDFYTLLAIP